MFRKRVEVELGGGISGDGLARCGRHSDARFHLFSAQHLAFGHREPFVERQSGAVDRTFSDSTYMGVKLLGHAVQLTRILTSILLAVSLESEVENQIIRCSVSRLIQVLIFRQSSNASWIPSFRNRPIGIPEIVRQLESESRRSSFLVHSKTVSASSLRLDGAMDIAQSEA